MKNLFFLIIISFFLDLAKATTVELYCRDFRFGMPLDRIPSRNGFSVMAQNQIIQNVSGSVSNVYIPFRVTVEQQFKATNQIAGKKGERLGSGQCGLASSVIKGINFDLSLGTPIIQFIDFRYSSFSSGGQYSGQTKSIGTVSLPSCASGVYVFTANVDSPNAYVVIGDSNVRCI
tara:strand:+ start:21781 stop:22305 length:525 start_codon:yes stop_codon:yes gene_type:complete